MCSVFLCIWQEKVYIEGKVCPGDHRPLAFVKRETKALLESRCASRLFNETARGPGEKDREEGGNITCKQTGTP